MDSNDIYLHNATELLGHIHWEVNIGGNGLRLRWVQHTVFDLITALCAKVFQNNWEHSVVVKYVSTY